MDRILLSVATVLTVYGIETLLRREYTENTYIRLQQYLPFTVLKHATIIDRGDCDIGCNSTYRLRY